MNNLLPHQSVFDIDLLLKGHFAWVTSGINCKIGTETLKNWENYLSTPIKAEICFNGTLRYPWGKPIRNQMIFFFFKWYLNTLSQLAEFSRVKEHLPQGYYSSQEDFPLTLEWYKQVQLSLHSATYSSIVYSKNY